MAGTFNSRWMGKSSLDELKQLTVKSVLFFIDLDIFRCLLVMLGIISSTLALLNKQLTRCRRHSKYVRNVYGLVKKTYSTCFCSGQTDYQNKLACKNWNESVLNITEKYQFRRFCEHMFIFQNPKMAWNFKFIKIACSIECPLAKQTACPIWEELVDNFSVGINFWQLWGNVVNFESPKIPKIWTFKNFCQSLL